MVDNVDKVEKVYKVHNEEVPSLAPQYFLLRLKQPKRRDVPWCVSFVAVSQLRIQRVI